MYASSLPAKRILLNSLMPLVLAAFFAVPLSIRAQDTDRQRALELYEANNFAAALPLLEKVDAAHPNDVEIVARLGFAVYAMSATEKDPATRAKLRERARSILLRSQSLGDESNLTMIVLEALSRPDASDVPFSNIRLADAATREGEEAFVKGDMDKAIAAYKRALEADPLLYDAALYAGDAEFKKGYSSSDTKFRKDHFEAAGVWFAKAISIDPNRETAYRYWGDTLDAEGRTSEARDKFIEAIVAEPYDRRPYVGLTQWGDRHQVRLTHPRIDIPANVATGKPGEINITIDPQMLKGSDDGSPAWLVYGITRAAWMNKKDGTRSDNFAKAYPKESTYRHSLAEEAGALRAVAESIETQLKDNRVKKLTASLENLKRLNAAGLLEPYILFVLLDEGIARDYIDYRAANRNQLKRYWLEAVVNGQ